MSIVYVGMDVHKEQYTLCSYRYEEDKVKYQQQVAPDYKMILKYLEQIRKHYTEEIEFVCGYEAGCLGYTWRSAHTAKYMYPQRRMKLSKNIYE